MTFNLFDKVVKDYLLVIYLTSSRLKDNYLRDCSMIIYNIFDRH